MKVICIDDSPRENHKNLEPHLIAVFKQLRFGEIYTVIGSTEPCYQLEEIPHPSWPSFGWRVERFAQISSISETTFERNYNKELV